MFQIGHAKLAQRLGQDGEPADFDLVSAEVSTLVLRSLNLPVAAAT